MSDVYLRGTVYWCWVKDHRGKWVRKSTGRRDKQAARLEKRRLERLYADPNHHAAHTTKIADAVERFIDERRNKGKAAGTITMYEQKSGHINRLLGGEESLSTVTAAKVDWYVAERLKEGAKPHSIHKELVTLRGTLKLARRRGEYTLDVGAVMPIGFSPQYVPRTTYLTVEQLHAMLEHLPPKRAAHVAYVVATGARRAEATRARRADVSKGFAQVRGSKTEKAARIVPVVVTVYQRLLARALRDAPGEDVLFEEWTNARRDIHKACDDAKVPKVTWNDLRRTFASWLKQAGVSNETLAELLGHTDTKMVRKVYGQDTPEALAESMRRQLGRRTITTQRNRKTSKKD